MTEIRQVQKKSQATRGCRLSVCKFKEAVDFIIKNREEIQNSGGTK